VLGAGVGGNLLEWYDFGIYGLLAPGLAGAFFPAEDRIAALIAACGYFLRRRLRETGYQPLPARANDPIPLKQAFTLAPGAMICAVLFTSGYGIVNYLTMVFLPVYASEFGTVAESRVLQINTAAQAVALLLVPFAG